MALRTVAEALTLQASRLLNLGPGELRAEFRPATTAAGRAGRQVEVYMYDTLSGGAGYSKRVGSLGIGLFEGTLELLRSCPAGCDASCYRCLRSYSNQFNHGLLDRHIGASLLGYLLEGSLVRLDDDRVAASADALAEDLRSHGVPGLSVSRDVQIAVPGFGDLAAPILATTGDHSTTAILLRHPFAPSQPLHRDWVEAAAAALDPRIELVDELAVRKNLPWASHKVLVSLGCAD